MKKSIVSFALLAVVGMVGINVQSASAASQAMYPSKELGNHANKHGHMQGKMTPKKHHEIAQQYFTEQRNKEIAETFWNEVFNNHNPEVIKTMVAEDYEQHNPDYETGRDAFYNAIAGYLQSAPESSAVIDNIGADGDYVYIHNHPKNDPQDRGQAAVDIFKIVDGKIVAHWDVLQNVPETAQNTNTMFFTKEAAN